MWKVRVFTLYPDLFPGPLANGIYKKALENKIWSLEVINIRDYAKDKHKTVDDTPFGGGSGMVIRADVLADALDKNILDKKETTIYLTPKGEKFSQTLAKKIFTNNLNIICGHFEGIDERVLETRNIKQISIGDYVLSGGEIGAFVRKTNATSVFISSMRMIFIFGFAKIYLLGKKLRRCYDTI